METIKKDRLAKLKDRETIKSLIMKLADYRGN